MQQKGKLYGPKQFISERRQVESHNIVNWEDLGLTHISAALYAHSFAL
jgi:hypothetical protein